MINKKTCLTALTITACATLLITSVASAAGYYFHYTTDSAYHDGDKTIQDPYNVQEGAGSANHNNHVIYWGPIGPHNWQDLQTQGWPYDLTRTFLAARYPKNIPNHFHFDHDAAAQLLAQGLTVEALDELYTRGTGYMALHIEEYEY